MEVPTTAEEVTAAWLTTALRSSHTLDAASVASLAIDPLVGEQGITGQLARLTLDYDRNAPGAPRRLIAKFSSPHPEGRAMVHAMGFYEREMCFYQQLATWTPVRTPRCYFAHLDPASGLTTLLLEDLAPARNGNSIRGCSLPEVAALMGALASLHARWWQDQSLPTKPWLRLTSMLAPEALARVFGESWSSFLGKLSIPVDDDIDELGAWINAELPRASAVLFDDEPRTLIHNDVQGDNLFFDDADRPLAFVDWQLTTYARGVIDVASLIRGSLDRGVRRRHEGELLETYHRVLLDRGVTTYPLEQCREDYRLATVLSPARLVSAVGTHPGLQAHPGAFWDVLVPRYCP